jgi:hypothetical protein
MMNRIIPIFAILVSIGLFFTYINPTYTGKIAAAKQQIASYDSALAAASAFTAKENELVQKRNAIPPDNIARIENYLPDGVNNIQLIIDLNALAARSGVTLADFSVHANQASPQDASQGKSPAPTTPSNSGGSPSAVAPVAASQTLQSTSLTNSLDLSVSATGSYTAFRSFLAATEQSARPLDVTQMSLKDSKNGVYTYNVTFRIYWLH